jgi:hypothetical protein
MKIKKMSQNDEGFWNLMGPFFASAEIQKKLKVSMASDVNHSWFVAVQDGSVCGFLALLPDKGKVFRIRYVYAQNNDPSLKTKLLKTASSNGPAIKRSMVFHDFDPWLNAGFVFTGKEKGKYREMSYTPVL